jgi:hypothetical protein
MNSWMAKFVAMTLLAASVLVMPSARAQLQSGPGSALGSDADGFEGLVDQDVAKGYYTAEQGEQLKAQWETSLQTLTDVELKAQAAIQRTDSIAQSGNQMTMDQMSSLANSQGQTNFGGTPEEIEEQAKAIYNGSHLQLEVGQAQLDNVQPILQTAMNEISSVLSARAALIQSNPNVSAEVKHNATKESAQVQDAADHSIEKGFSTMNAQLQAAQTTLDNNKQQIIDQIKTAIATQVATQGSDPTKWTKPATPTPPAKTALPPNAVVVPNDPDAKAPTPNLPGTPQVYVPTPNGSATGSTATSKGTVPSNQPDPALSATRNSNNGQGTATPGTGTPSNNSGNSRSSNTGAGKPSANTASTTSNNSSSPAKATNQVPVKISQVLTNPSVPKTQTPPAPPKVTQQDIDNALNKKANIPNLPVATLPSTAPPNAPVDKTAITLANKTPSNPSGTGKSVNNNSPASKSGQPVLMPSSKQNLGMPPQTTPTADDADQSQNPAPASGSAAASANAGADAANAAANSDAAANTGNAASTASDAAADSSSSSQSDSQSNQSSGIIIPTTPNNPNAESMTDPAFNAYRNNPDANPANGAPISGDVSVGTPNVNQGPLVPPNQQTPDSDAAAQADAAAAAAAAAGVDSSTSSQAPAPPTNQPSGQPTLTDIETQIANQMRAGNAGGHLIEGEDELAGNTDATSGLQLPSLSDQLALLNNPDMSVEYGDTVTTATLASIYKGYTVTAGQNGSSVIVAGTTQVATRSSLMTSPSMQVSTPGAMMTSPSMQVQFPSSVMTDPSSQVQFPSSLMVIPSSQINFPSSLMTSLDMQVTLCGR